MNFLSALLGLHRASNPRSSYLRADQDRLQQYTRFLRAYLGYSLRALTTETAGTAAEKRLRFNFHRPIVNLGAGFMAARPLDWAVDSDPELTKECYRIWDRSGSDSLLLDGARCCGIYGDLVGIATQDADGQPRIEFVSPDICFPTFDGSDYRNLVELEIRYQATDRAGRSVAHAEFYTRDRLTVYEDNEQVREVIYDEFPCVWIRNQALKGLPYGIGDVEPVVELVEEYDHICRKQTQIIDYYAKPNLVFKGVQKSQVDMGINSAWFLPAVEADAFFVEWRGNSPDIENHLTRLRNTIAEVSQVPPVAFGQADSGLTSISGIALEILYGPLITKTRDKQSNWSPALERLMWLCLRSSGAAGAADAAPGAVNAVWPDALPVDGAAKVAQETAAVASNLRSRRTAMNNLGIENPDDELKRIVVEEMLLLLGKPPADPVQIARAAGKGTPVAEARAPGVVDVSPLEKARGAGADLAGRSLSELLELFDGMVAAEAANLEPEREEAE